MFVTNGDIRIHYEVEGTGHAVIMRTGAGGDSQIWRYAGYLAGMPAYKKILIDQRGRGISDRPTTLESHRFQWHISDIIAVMDDAGVESAGFMGYSAGAVMGVAFGAAHPNRLRALVGIGSLPFSNFSDERPADPEAEIKRIVSIGGVKAEYESAMRGEGGRFPEAIERNVLEGDPLMRALDSVAVRTEGWNGPLDIYPTLKFPVLMVAGEREDTKRETDKSISRIPRGRLVRIPQLAHLSAFYRSDLTLPHILPFLKEHLG